MRKISTLLLLLLCYTFGYSKEVSQATALNVGYNYLIQNGGSSSINSKSDLKLVYASNNGSADLFYVFAGKHCFVIVSAEDNVIPVLGYSLDNTFKASNMPVQIADFLGGYKEQIEYVKANHVNADQKIATTWSNLVNNIRATNSNNKTTAVSPLLSTTWNQSPYYNDYCPYDYSGGGRSVTGCVATATAQVMKFWNWPTTGSGFHSYSTSSYGTLSANFASHSYNWSAMPASVGSTNTAVAQLMSDVGISVDMNYSSSSSGAYVVSSASPVTNCAEYALRTYFNYDGSLHGEERSGYSDGTWISMLEADLNAGRPIIYAGFGTGGGHCFVFDGFDASHNFHVNWGWGGYSDGYFAVNALNPSGTGTGGGSGGYNSGQQAILGVKPGGGGGGGSTSVDTLALYNYINLSASTINYGGAFTVTTDIGNFGVHNFSGDLCAAAFDYTTGNFVCYVDSIMSVNITSYTYVTATFTTGGLLPMLPGMYKIGIFHRPSGGSWNAVWNYSVYTNFEPISVVNHNPIQLNTAITTSSSSTSTSINFIQGAAGSVSLTLRNYTGSSYSGSYDVSLYNSDGTFNSTIQTLTGMSLASGAASSTLTFSTSSITATPGTYLLAVKYSSGSSWYLAGADYHTNPIYVTVGAPPPSPDMYEVNNTAATAYNLPLTFSSNVATSSTPGSNFHTTTDQDYYKIVLPSGYNYSIKARVNDNLSSDAGGTYTTDASWSYSTDNGATWSAVYTDAVPGAGTFSILGGAGGTVIFHVSPSYAGDLGNYLFKLVNVTRTPNVSIPEVNLEAIKIYPNPASDYVTIDLEQTNAVGSTICISNVTGRQVYCEDITGKPVVKIPVQTLADGMYFVDIATQSGVTRKKITVSK